MKTLAIIFLGFAFSVQAQISTITNIIPANRLPAAGCWTPGVVGGLQQYSSTYTQFCNVKISIPGTNIVAAGNGTTDDTAALQAAINLCPNRAYVYLPAGNYLTTSTLTVKGYYDGSYTDHVKSIVIKGAGMTNTFIIGSDIANDIIYFAPGAGISDWQKFTTNVYRGARTATVADASLYYSGEYVFINQADDTNFIQNANGTNCFYTPSGYETKCIGQWMYVTNIAGNTLYFDRPLNSSYYTTNTATASRCISPCVHSGLENLAVLNTNVNENVALHNIHIYNSFECWLTNVQSIAAVKWHVRVDNCARCEFRECYVHDGWDPGGDGDYGIGYWDINTDCLAIDNIFYHCRHSMVTEWGGQGNVWAYNYSKDPINSDQFAINAMNVNTSVSNNWAQRYAAETATDFIMGDMIQHGGEPEFDLWEGNVAARMSFDAVHGSSHYLTMFRCWSQRQSLSVTGGERAVEDMNANYNENVVGNVLMTPGQTANVYDWYLGGPFPTNGLGVWRFGYSADGDTFYGDTNCMATIIRHLNYDFWTGSNHLAAGISYTNLPPSLFLTSAPNFWPTNLAWPAMGPDVPGETNSASAYPIPAMARFYGGSLGGTRGVSGPPLAPPQNLRIVQ